MKSRKSLYILIPCVVLVWALVLYRVMDFSSDSVLVSNEKVNLTVTDYEGLFKKDTFQLSANYRDPFLGKHNYERKPVAKVIRPKKPIKKEVKKEEEPVKWPAIVYKGVIENKDSDQRFAIISINGSDHIMNEGMVEGEVSLDNIYPDSVKVTYSTISAFVAKIE